MTVRSPVGYGSVASKELPAPTDGPAIPLSDRDALRLLFLLALSNRIGLRPVRRVMRIWGRLLISHRSFLLHNLLDDHGLGCRGDFNGLDCADARCFGASDFYRWVRGRRGPFRAEHDEQIDQDDVNYGAGIQRGDAAGELIARRNGGTGRRRQERDETSRNRLWFRPRQRLIRERFDQGRQSLRCGLLRHPGQLGCLPPRVEVEPRQRRQDTEQHSIFFLADMRKEKGVELRPRRQNRRRIFHTDH
jgi:hypothetical protein